MDNRIGRLTRTLTFWRWSVFAILDFVAANVVWWFARSGDEAYPLGSLLLVVLGIELVQLVLQFRGFLWLSFSALFVEPKGLESMFLEILRESKLPAPSDHWVPRNLDGIGDMANLEDLPVRDRLEAMSLYATWKAAVQSRGTFFSLVLGNAWDKAIERYDREMSGVRRPQDLEIEGEYLD